jgi:glycosyltransferase involved in cell wall biosynthesis
METTASGGINKAVAEIGEILSNQGHEVVVLQPNPLNLPAEEVYKNFKIIRVKSKIGDFFYGISPEIYFYLKKHFKKLNPDFIHVHGYGSLFSLEVIYIIKKNYPRIQIVFSPHFGKYSHDTFAGRYLWSIYNQLIGKKAMQFSNKIIAASEFEANNIINILGVSKEKVEVIPHGINIEDFKKKKRNSNTIRLLSAGYLLKLKGVQYVIKSLHEIIYTMNIKAELTIVGEGPYEKKLKKLAIKSKVDEFINWRGFFPQNELLNEFKKNDIFFLLSESENYGIVVAEALACGTPAIVTRRTALEEFIKEPGCFGVDYPPDPEEVAKLVLKIINSNIKVGPFSKKIRTWDKVVEDYERIYSNLLAEKI